MFQDGRHPIRYGLRMEIDDKYQSLKTELSQLCGVPASRLLLAEVCNSFIRVSWGATCCVCGSVWM